MLNLKHFNNWAKAYFLSQRKKKWLSKKIYELNVLHTAFLPWILWNLKGNFDFSSLTPAGDIRFEPFVKVTSNRYFIRSPSKRFDINLIEGFWGICVDGAYLIFIPRGIKYKILAGFSRPSVFFWNCFHLWIWFIELQRVR